MSQGTAGGEGAPQVLPEGKERQRKRRRRKKESKTRLVRSSLLLPEAEAEKSKRTVLACNRLKTTKYTALSFLPKNLFEQFHRLANVYFVFIALLNFVPAVNAFQPELALAPVLFILAVTAIKDLWEDYSRYRSDNEINHMECLVYSSPKSDSFSHSVDKRPPSIRRVRNEKKYISRYWKEVKVGDFVQLRCNEIIPADILLLSSSDPDGLCHIETANLDGETNLKQRQVVRRFLELVKGAKLMNLRLSAMVAKNFSCPGSLNRPIQHIPYPSNRPSGKPMSLGFSGKSAVKECIRLLTGVPVDDIYTEGLRGKNSNSWDYAEKDSEFDPLKFTSVIECEKPNNDLSRFRGSIIHKSGKKDGLFKENLLLRGCTIRNTEEVAGIVIYAGHETKAFLNNNGPRYKRSKLERQMNADVLWCVLILLIMCLFSAIGHGLWVWQYGEKKKPIFDVPGPDGKYLSPVLASVYLFLTVIIVFQVLIPISLYVSIEIVKICQVYFIHQDKDLYDEETDSQLQCRALNITEDLGQVQFIFSDKTGTLTENKMVFRRCTVSGTEYSHDDNAKRLAMYQEPDSEEDETAPKGGTLSHRDSICSHQSIKVIHRSQSTKTHRRTGSRAEAKRASILSKHTAFSSPMSQLFAQEQSNIGIDLIKYYFCGNKLKEKDITPDPRLLEKVNECAKHLEAMRSHEQLLSHLSPELCDIFDFFIALTICNTVVVTAPNQPRQKVRDRFELKSPVKTIEDFIRRFTPSRLTSGSNSSSSSLATSKSVHRFGLSVLSSPSTDSTLLQLEEKLAYSAQMNNNGYSSQQGRTPVGSSPEEGELRYEAESPDEAALVYAARAYNCSLVGRLSDQVSVELPHLGTLSFEVLHTLGFDSIRKRMSVVVRHPLTDEINVYTKGADSVIMDLLLPCSSDDPRGKHQKKIRSKTQNYLNLYAVDGLRTLCIAKRVLSKEEYACWLKTHLEAESSIENREELLFQSALRIEKNLHLLGATGIEDRLQDGVPETIANLRKAGLQIWVLTGDKQETAVNIAYACKLLDHDEEIITLNAESPETCAVLLEQCLQCVESKFSNNTIDEATGNMTVGFTPLYPSSSSVLSSLGLVIDGRTLAYALEPTLEDKFLALAKRCRSVLCCRSTPLQKSMVVTLVRDKLKAMTLAIGDGANDVSMIQVADVGVGISGQEGMQAVMASDFAIPRFRHLEKLLLVHGHWCYSRLANMVLYFFYKNAMFVALLFWYQFYCGFSGSSMIDQWYLIFFNLLFSSLPQLITGVLDKDVPAEVLIAVPQLYKSGQNMEEYQPHMFWMNMIDAMYQSLVCFFIPYFAYYDSEVDIFSWGTPITTIALLTIILHLAIETKTWTFLHWSSCIFSIVLFFFVALVYNASCPVCYPPSNPYWTMERLMGDPIFYLTCIISPVVALLPRFLYRTLQGTLFPTQLQLGRQLSKLAPEIRTHLLTKLNVKETIRQARPFADSFSPSLGSNASDYYKAYNQSTPLPTSPQRSESLFQEHTKAEHKTDQTVAASPQGAVLYGENKLPSSASSLERSMGFHEVRCGTSEVEPLPVATTFPWSSAVDQGDFSLWKWITSTPLFSHIGTVLQVSSSSLQNETQDSMCVLDSSLHVDFKGLKEQSSNNLQDKMKGTSTDHCKNDNSETTFL
ncbi:putative phospholipid-transporting ATPase VA [Willisornis vidua]|uniref:Phospholipid-transporting ATPase n=1 Tax=Willisornis vidua TaxID=1566151 RepID=A0ABQ9CU91_9PASS|nr:putative phospholipid-transporting ATPase VA [Willisornis vidua]